MQEHLCDSATAASVFGVVSHFAGAVSAFKAVRLRDVTVTLRVTASRLKFVAACSTRVLQLATGVDVTATSGPTKVTLIFVCFTL